jgi:hypothetical protein
MGGSVGAAAAAAVLAGHVPPGRLDPEESGYVLAALAAVGAAVVAAVVAYVLVPARSDPSLTGPDPTPRFRITMRMDSR